MGPRGIRTGAGMRRATKRPYLYCPLVPWLLSGCLPRVMQRKHCCITAGGFMAKDKGSDQTSELSLADFFSANEARRDRWSELAACADAWGNGRGSSDKLLSRIGALLDELQPLEAFWAYPGGLMRPVRSLFDSRDARGLASAVDRIKTSIFSGSYRRDAKAWNIDEEAEES